jgi:hypothetical protein
MTKVHWHTAKRKEMKNEKILRIFSRPKNA